MSTLAEKLDIIQWVAGLNDKTTIQQLKKMKEQSATKEQDWWDALSVEERQSIERGLEDSKKGRITPHSEVRKRYEKWL
jgi:predicted transcriptional regulator